jgi:undecaprenyl diphosphate synthase
VSQLIVEAERATAGGTRLHLRLALDSSARRAILAALLGAMVGPPGPTACFGPDVDLLIRTGGEQRLGDFQLWECAYAELLFVATPWAEFGERDLAAAVAEFRRRERDFGALPGADVCDSPAPVSPVSS